MRVITMFFVAIGVLCAQPQPTQAEVTAAVQRWVDNVKLDRPDKLVIQGVKVVGRRSWPRDWNNFKLTGKGADAFPQRMTYDTGWEVCFTATTVNRDGVTSYRVPQAVLILADNPPRVKFAQK